MIEAEKQTEEIRQRAVLCGVDNGEFDMERSMQELESLADTAGAEVLAVFVQKTPRFDPATFVGSGKLAEITEFCKNNDVELIIFNHELTASQMRNIEDAADTDVVDRTMLIIDIFAQRAKRVRKADFRRSWQGLDTTCRGLAAWVACCQGRAAV